MGGEGCSQCVQSRERAVCGRSHGPGCGRGSLHGYLGCGGYRGAALGKPQQVLVARYKTGVYVYIHVYIYTYKCIYTYIYISEEEVEIYLATGEGI